MQPIDGSARVDRVAHAHIVPAPTRLATARRTSPAGILQRVGEMPIHDARVDGDGTADPALLIVCHASLGRHTLRPRRWIRFRRSAVAPGGRRDGVRQGRGPRTHGGRPTCLSSRTRVRAASTPGNPLPGSAVTDADTLPGRPSGHRHRPRREGLSVPARCPLPGPEHRSYPQRAEHLNVNQSRWCVQQVVCEQKRDPPRCLRHRPGQGTSPALR